MTGRVAPVSVVSRLVGVWFPGPGMCGFRNPRGAAFATLGAER